MIACAVGAAALGLAPMLADAQIPTVSSGGKLSNPAAPPPSAAPPPRQGPIIINTGPDGKVTSTQLGGEVGGPQDFYYSDGEGINPSNDIDLDLGGMGGGPVPNTHVVRKGDTLWDLCWFYFNNPWDWPRVWSYNPTISNPHWIYPGDIVRLIPGSGDDNAGNDGGDGGDGSLDGGDVVDLRPSNRPHGNFSLRQLAFIDKEELKYSATVEGSTEEKLLLSRGDSIYLAYPEGKPPKVGKRYAIYEPRNSVNHPDSGKEAGSYVKVIGELEVVSVKKDKRARAIIRDSNDVIERGALVGPLQKQFIKVDPVRNKVDLQGTIIAQLENDKLIGAQQVVFIDKGTEDGVEEGNRLFVIRRGDAYPELREDPDVAGQDDRRYPARAIGEVLVVQAGKKSSVALVTLAVQELGVGDHVLMRKAR